jgi:hypothetical protein
MARSLIGFPSAETKAPRYRLGFRRHFRHYAAPGLLC